MVVAANVLHATADLRTDLPPRLRAPRSRRTTDPRRGHAPAGLDRRDLRPHRRVVDVHRRGPRGRVPAALARANGSASSRTARLREAVATRARGSGREPAGDRRPLHRSWWRGGRWLRAGPRLRGRRGRGGVGDGWPRQTRARGGRVGARAPRPADRRRPELVIDPESPATGRACLRSSTGAGTMRTSLGPRHRGRRDVGEHPARDERRACGSVLRSCRRSAAARRARSAAVPGDARGAAGGATPLVAPAPGHPVGSRQGRRTRAPRVCAAPCVDLGAVGPGRGGRGPRRRAHAQRWRGPGRLAAGAALVPASCGATPRRVRPTGASAGAGTRPGGAGQAGARGSPRRAPGARRGRDRGPRHRPQLPRRPERPGPAIRAPLRLRQRVRGDDRGGGAGRSGAGRGRRGDRAWRPAAFRHLVTAARRSWSRSRSRLTFEEAATLPVAFMTAAHVLPATMAQLEAGGRVLIHAAAGGVGHGGGADWRATGGSATCSPPRAATRSASSSARSGSSTSWTRGPSPSRTRSGG